MLVALNSGRTGFAVVALALWAGFLNPSTATADPGDPQPSSGSISTSATTLNFTGSTLAGANVAGAPPQVGSTGFNPCLTGVIECDEFELTVTLPAGYKAANPDAVLRVTLDWGSADNDYDVFFLDGEFGTIASTQTGNKPEVLDIPVTDGTNTYYIDIIPWMVTLEDYVGTVELRTGAGGGGGSGGGGGGGGGGPTGGLADATPSAPGLPRYQNFVAPRDTPGYDGFQGEFNIGFNPHSGRLMTMASGEVFRLTLPEQQSPALPASCDALWEDVSAPSTNTPAGLDPILFTDQDSGRTFSSNFTGGANAEYAFTDDDGELWVPLGVSPPNGGFDHQTIGTGPYPKDSPYALLSEAVGFGNAVYYCSQIAVGAVCQRSDDGGISFGPGIPAYEEITGSCASLHGHVRVAPNGTVYLPTAICGDDQGGGVSYDAGDTWQEFHVAGLNNTNGSSSDPSVAIDDANNAYFCTVDTDGHPKVSVSSDNGATWTAPYDLGAELGITQAAFPSAIAGSSGRAACGFLAAKSAQTNWQSLEYDGIWYVYIATTYDGGQTWTLSNATPNDPAQGAGGICLSGQGCNSSPNNRNLLDFNEITLDSNGYVLYGYDDGCIEDCVTDPTNGSFTATMTVARQTGGDPLRVGRDEGSARAPAQPCLALGSSSAAGTALRWKAPDDGGSAINGYTLTRLRTADGSLQRFDVSSTTFVDPDNTGGSGYTYAVAANNGRGTGPISNTVGDPAQIPTNAAPDASLIADPVSGVTPLEVVFSISATDADGDTLGYTLNFGDGSDAISGTVPDSVRHSYNRAGMFTASLSVSDGKGGSDTAATAITVNSPTGGNSSDIVARLSADKTEGKTPLTVAFDASSSKYADDTAVRSPMYTFVYGDGTRSEAQTAATISHTYEAAGTFKSYVIVTDADQNVDVSDFVVIEATVEIVVTPGNETVAQLTVDRSSGPAPLTVNFDGSRSIAADGTTIQSYRFDFGDGSPVQTGSSPTARHTYTQPGSYQPTLTINDDQGGSSVAKAAVAVAQPTTPGTGNNATSGGGGGALGLLTLLPLLGFGLRRRRH